MSPLEKFDDYIVGNSDSRFAITKAKDWAWRWPWQKPNGGWRLGRIIVWWAL